MAAGQDGMIACHSHFNEGVWSDQSNQRKKKQRSVLTLEQGPLREQFNHVKATS